MYHLCSQEDTVSGDIKVQLSRSEEERRKLEKECAIYQSQLEVPMCLRPYVYSNAYIKHLYICMLCIILGWYNVRLQDMSSHNSTSNCTG